MKEIHTKLRKEFVCLKSFFIFKVCLFFRSQEV